MEISLSKTSEVPLRQQLAEQIVVQITTGELRAGQQLASVRSLARRLKIHHNTVSEAYQDLVRRGWLARRRGRRLVVGTGRRSSRDDAVGLDELINETIQRAKEMGFTLQTLTERVRARMQQEPADHILVVEDEAGLREVICIEVQSRLGWPVEGCSVEHFVAEPELALGAQMFAPEHIKEALKSLLPANHPATWITYSAADEHSRLIRGLKNPSAIAAVSISASLLKSARSLFASALGRRHTLHEVLLAERKRTDLRGMDLVFCDSIAMKTLSAPNKIHYQLVSEECLLELASTMGPAPRKV
jgi:DNA-binding transcriptional regulator YhcF (GntR family)